MVCGRITLQECALCSLLEEEIPRQTRSLAKALQWGNLTKMQFYALDLRGISFHCGLAELCLSETVPGMALSCSEQFWSDSSFPPWILALSASLNLLPQRESWLTQAAPANVAAEWAKDAEEVRFVCRAALRAWQKCSERAKGGWERAHWGQPGHGWVRGEPNIYCCVQSSSNAFLERKTNVCRGWCCKEQGYEVFAACLPARRTEQGWGLSVHARCAWAPLAE